MGLAAPSRGISGPALGSRAITPSNTVAIAGGPARSLYVTVTGDVNFLDVEGNTVVCPAVPAYTTIPVACVRVNATGTTATVRTLD